MMFIRHVKNELSAYLDGQLPQKLKAKVEKHLEGCDACKRELERLKMLSAQLNMWKAPGLGEDFDSSVRGKIVSRELERGQVKMEKRRVVTLIPAGVLAGILLLVCLNVAVKHGITGKLAQVTGIKTDQAGEQYTPGHTLDATRSYEPYYMQSYTTTTSQAATKKVALADNKLKGSDYYADGDGEFERMKGRSYNSVRGQVVTREVYAPAASPVQEKPAEPVQGTVIVIQPSIPATGIGDYIIRTGVIQLEVEDSKEAYNTASRICKELGGYMAASNFFKDKEGRHSGTITMRIPRDKFAESLDRLSTLGKVEDIATSSQDVSQDYANLKAKLDAEMVVYNKVLEALQKRQNTIPEAMRLESELTPILKRVEYLKNQIVALDNAVSFTTVKVNFHESGVSVKALKDSKHFIKDSMVTAGIKSVKFLAAILPMAILIAALLILALVTILIIKFLMGRITKK